MACSNYRILQMTDNNVGAVSANAFMPLGTITRKIGGSNTCASPFEVTTSGADTVSLTSKGYYKVQYVASVVAGGAGTVTLALVAGGTTVASVSATAASGDTVVIPIVYDVRVFANCSSNATNCPMNIQIQNTGVALTGGTSNLIVDSCVSG